MTEFGEKAGRPTTAAERRTSRYLNLTRLPSLQEVLERRTRPPLDLFCFYRESSEDALDFWLDVQQHENLCKAYFKDVRRSGRTVDDDWPEYAAYAREHGSYFAPLLALDASPDPNRHRFSSPVHPGGAGSQPASPLLPSTPALGSPAMPQGSPGSPQSVPGAGAAAHDVEARGAKSSAGSRLSASARQSLGATFKRKSRAPTIFARDRAIEKAALVESAERVYLRYLLPGAEREIYLPPALRLTNFPVSAGPEPSPLIPDLFHAQKVYIFKALEQDAFPRFLRAKAFANLTPVSAFVRLVAGLAILWGGFVLAFSLIFLDWKPKITRLWLILPLLVAVNLLLSAYYTLDPLLAAFCQSETTPFRLIRVRETYVRRLLVLRALWLECAAVLITAVLVVIFTVVPGYRL